MLAMLLVGLQACQRGQQGLSEAALVDSLNQAAYAWRYRDVAQSFRLSEEAFQRSGERSAQALLNMAYVAYQQMNFEEVDTLLRHARSLTANQVTLLEADVIEMKAKQRTSDFATFYQARHDALQRLSLVQEEQADLSPIERQRFIYAQSEYHIIASTYHYYQGQDELSVREIEAVAPQELLLADKAQWLYYNYMMGSGGMVQTGTSQEVLLCEFDYMMLTYMEAHRDGNLYFEANALQMIAQMLSEHATLISSQRADDVAILASRAMACPPDSLALRLCQEAINLFRIYDDLYQTACALRTRGELQFQAEDYEASLASYEAALSIVNLHHTRYYHDTDTLCIYDSLASNQHAEIRWMQDSLVQTVPSWIAGIRQQISKTYSALGMKAESDYNRNAYIDILQHTDQNVELLQRSEMLSREARRMQWQGALSLVMFLFMTAMLYANRRRISRKVEALREELRSLQAGERVPQDVELERERQEEAEELLDMSQMKLERNKAQNVENRARVSMVRAVVPYLDRIVGEVVRMKREGHASDERKEYILELVEKIMQYNDVLTEWISMRQGQVALRIRTVELSRIFDVIRSNRFAFESKGLRLEVEPTSVSVKADEALTLFMLNTLADNARKFTPSGGTICVRCEAHDDYAELSVSDTGVGLSQADLDTLNNSAVYDPQAIGSDHASEKGFGFGLANCRGIIEKYKKHSVLFQVCQFGVRNNAGPGCTFFFRLPRVLSLIALILSATLSMAQPSAHYDSLYVANIEGRYADAISHGERALRSISPALRLRGEGSDAPEVRAFLRGDTLDFATLMGVRNELALSALALRDWQLYEYNNLVYTQLRKLLNQDSSLPFYYQRLEAYHHNARLLLVLTILFLLIILAMLYRWLINRRLAVGKDVERQITDYHTRWLSDERQRADQLADLAQRSAFEENRLYVQNQVLSNCLSTIKHESMYYPARIQAICANLQDKDIALLDETVSYYRHIYTILCSQADDQVAQPGFKRQSIEADWVAELFCKAARKQGGEPNIEMAQDVRVSADAMLLQQLAQQLMSVPGWGSSLCHIAIEVEGRFVGFRLSLSGIELSPSEAAQLFTPDSPHLACFIARQILREHDTYSGNPGLRLMAEPSDEGLTVYFTLLAQQTKPLND